MIVPDVGVDLLAGELDLDPADIRGRNLLRPDELPYATVTNQHDGGDYPEALERVLAAIDYGGFREREHAARAEGRLLGIGLSCYAGYTGINSRVFHGRGMVGIAGYDSAYATIDGDGRATVWTTLPAIGPGLETTFAQMAADSLGLDVDAVRVALRHFGRRPARHRRVRQPQRDLGGGAIRCACTELRSRILQDAVKRLEAEAGDLEIVGSEVRVTGSLARLPGRPAADGHQPALGRVRSRWIRC